MKPLLLLVAVVSATSCFSQKAPLKFGEIPPEVLAMTTYEADPTADAVVLADYGISSIEKVKSNRPELNFDRTTRIKVLTEAGKRWAEFTINLYGDNNKERAENLSIFRAVTVNLENGAPVESHLSKDALFTERRTNDLTIVKGTLPNVQVGSVIDITYRIRSGIFNNFRDWEFQTTIPTAWSEYRAIIPAEYQFSKYMQGYVPLTVNENFRWAAQNVPTFREEPFMTTRNDYISRLNFELLTSWEQVNRTFAESPDFLEAVSGNASLRKIAEEITASATTAPQKIEAIHSYVRNTVKWNGASRTSAESNLKDVLARKRGSSAEINLLIASMLDKVKVQVRPVLLSTREHGIVWESIPAARQFNYTICQATWDDKMMLLDGTNPFLLAGYLPSRCMNSVGMAVSSSGPEWIVVRAPSKTRSVVNFELDLSATGVLSGLVRMEHYGNSAAEQRQKYVSQGDVEYVAGLAGNRPWEFTGSEFTNVEDVKEGFKEKHHVVINEHASTAGDVVYMNPFIESRWRSNPFKSEKRQYPVDFGNAFDEVYIIKVKLPAGYKVEEMPQPKLVLMPDNAARYTYSSAVDGNVITITSNLLVNKSLFSAEEYEGLREFFNRVATKQTEVVFIKKN